MMQVYTLLAVALFGISTYADNISLLDALKTRANATKFAEFLEANPAILAFYNSPSVGTVFAPTDAYFMALRRRDNTSEQLQNSTYQSCNKTQSLSDLYPTSLLSSISSPLPTSSSLSSSSLTSSPSPFSSLTSSLSSSSPSSSTSSSSPSSSSPSSSPASSSSPSSLSSSSPTSSLSPSPSSPSSSPLPSSSSPSALSSSSSPSLFSSSTSSPSPKPSSLATSSSSPSSSSPSPSISSSPIPSPSSSPTPSSSPSSSSTSLAGSLPSPQALPGVVVSTNLLDPQAGGFQVIVSQKPTSNSNGAGGTTGIQLVSGLGNNVNIIKGDIPYINGLIHSTDGFFTIPSSLSSSIQSNGLTTLSTLLSSANLTNTLDAANSVTVFTPNNAAFSAVPNSTNDTATLPNLLSNHVIPNFLGYLPNLKDGASYKTLAGDTLTISIRNGVYFVNGAKIISANNILTNGVAHMIDKVLVPNPNLVVTGGSGSFIRDNSVVAALTATLLAILMI